MTMNTAVQRNHRIVVGAGVAVVALIGMGVGAVSIHHQVLAKRAASASSGSYPTSSTPPANAAQDSPAPPTTAEGAPLTDSNAAATAAAPTAETAPTTTQTPQTSAATPKQAMPSSTPKAEKSASSSPPITATHPRSEPAAATPSKDTAAESTMASVPSGQGAIAPLAATSTAAGAGAYDASGTVSTNVASEAPGTSSVAAAETSGEVTTTMQARAAGADSVNSDRMITSAVQSQIAADPAGAGLAVNTINGVVILTGSVTSADAINHVKQAAQEVKDVKGVDATAVRVSGS